jgi:hypothetical protein
MYGLGGGGSLGTIHHRPRPRPRRPRPPKLKRVVGGILRTRSKPVLSSAMAASSSVPSVPSSRGHSASDPTPGWLRNGCASAPALATAGVAKASGWEGSESQDMDASDGARLPIVSWFSASPPW